MVWAMNSGSSGKETVREWFRCHWQGVLVWGGGLICLLAYHLIFSRFFPTSLGRMGHDWALANNLPAKLGEPIVWGWASMAGGSPAVCNGGVSLGLTTFPLSFDGWLSAFGLDPLNVAYANFLFFAVLGLVGMYLLLLRVFGLGVVAAFLGAVLFLFNSFYATRIIIGHPYYSLMGVPLLVFLLARSPRLHLGFWSELAHGAFAGVMVFYLWNAGLMYSVAVFMLSLLAVLFLALLAGASLQRLIVRGFIALVVVLGWAWLSLSQSLFSPAIGSAIAQRQSYSLQGFESLFGALTFLVKGVFFASTDMAEQYARMVVNVSVGQGLHELEYGLGPAAFLVLLLAVGLGIYRWLHSDVFCDKAWWRKRGLWIVSLCVLLFFPVFYNTYSPLTNSLWKSLPLISATTSPQRTYFVYTITFSILAAWWVQVLWPRRWLLPTVICVVIATVTFSALRDYGYYLNQPYDTRPVMAMWDRLKQGEVLPPITEISLFADGEGNFVHSQMEEVNERLSGRQSMGCYIPGYSSAPVELVKSLHPGSIWEVTDGYFNIKNPACNTWPKENNCSPGEHFRVDQREWVEKFIRYEPYPVAIPERVRLAAEVSHWAIYLTVGYFAVFAALWVRRRWWVGRS